MGPDAFKHLYDYHFSLNHRLWERCIVPLTDEQFSRKVTYSVGSVRNHVVHLMTMEERWFSGLRGLPLPGMLNPVHFPSRVKIRARWDGVEADMRAYLETLTESSLTASGGYKNMTVWQVLFHVLNHGTDHRAQLLGMLKALGADTFAQDYALFVTHL